MVPNDVVRLVTVFNKVPAQIYKVFEAVTAAVLPQLANLQCAKTSCV